jgi:hypothetical protein
MLAGDSIRGQIVALIPTECEKFGPDELTGQHNPPLYSPTRRVYHVHALILHSL